METRRTDLHTCVLVEARYAYARSRSDVAHNEGHAYVRESVGHPHAHGRVSTRTCVMTWRACARPVVRGAFACVAGNQLCASIGFTARDSIFSFLPMLGRDRMSRDAG